MHEIPEHPPGLRHVPVQLLQPDAGFRVAGGAPVAVGQKGVARDHFRTPLDMITRASQYREMPCQPNSHDRNATTQALTASPRKRGRAFTKACRPAGGARASSSSTATFRTNGDWTRCFPCHRTTGSPDSRTAFPPARSRAPTRARTRRCPRRTPSTAARSAWRCGNSSGSTTPPTAPETLPLTRSHRRCARLPQLSSRIIRSVHGASLIYPHVPGRLRLPRFSMDHSNASHPETP